MPARLLFAFAVGLSAALLFSVQPLIGKRVLPTLGGTAGTWIAIMTFFQVLVLAGYAASHVLLRWLGLRGAALVQVSLVGLGLVGASLDPDLSSIGASSSTATETASLLIALAAAVGIPGLALAATAPALQRWFAARDSAPDPYWLYVASNVGSLGVLVAYPVVIEPLLTLEAQTTIWRSAYIVLALATLGCAASIWRAEPRLPAEGQAEALPARRRAWWFWCAFLASSLMMGATTHITMDLAPVPLLWVLPLAIYLASYAVAFSRFGVRVLPALTRLAPLAVAPIVPLTVLGIAAPAWATVLAHLAVLAWLCLVFHAELSRTRPPADRLTELYLWLAVGGLAGGVLHALVAPLVMTSPVEYPATLALCLLSLPRGVGGSKRLLAASLVVAAVGASLLIGVSAEDPLTGTPIGYGAFALLLLPFIPGYRWHESAGLGLAVLLALALALTDRGSSKVHEVRSFFASYRVGVDDRRQLRYLAHGRTIHGAQSLRAEYERWPLPYHHPKSPIARLMLETTTTPGARVAVVGLGVGALAAYASEDTRLTFFEIDPVMEQIARADFDFLDRCARCEVVLGDGRVRLGEADSSFDLIVLDAFNSSAVPTHLLTLEAFALYRDRLAPGGRIAVHVTNRYVDLEPLLAASATRLGFEARINEHTAPDIPDLFLADSRWVVMARSGAELGPASAREGWRSLEDAGTRPWTDAHADVLAVLRW